MAGTSSRRRRVLVVAAVVTFAAAAGDYTATRILSTSVADPAATDGVDLKVTVPVPG